MSTKQSPHTIRSRLPAWLELSDWLRALEILPALPHLSTQSINSNDSLTKYNDLPEKIWNTTTYLKNTGRTLRKNMASSQIRYCYNACIMFGSNGVALQMPSICVNGYPKHMN
jgi:hypothetical protein